MSDPEPLITPPPALGPPIIGTDTPGSAPGIPQPVIVSGGESLPPSFPLGSAGTWLPPPQVGMGGNAPFSPSVVVPASVPPSTAGFTQPQYKTGSGTAPTAASLFPAFTSPGPSPPIVLNATQAAGGPYLPSPPAAPPAWIKPPSLPLPTTPGTTPILMSNVSTIPQMPWTLPPILEHAPNVSGSLTTGSTLTCTSGIWQNYPTSYAYQWLRSGVAIAGATASTYVLVAADSTHVMSCEVTATNATGSATSISNEVHAALMSLAPAEEEPLPAVEPPPLPPPPPKPKHKRH